MSDHLQPDSLSAFLEGVLPEHEREACLAHLAECAGCREIVYAAQEPATAPSSSRKRWFIPVAVFAAVFAAAIVVVVVRRSTPPPLPVMAENRLPAPLPGEPPRMKPAPFPETVPEPSPEPEPAPQTPVAPAPARVFAPPPPPPPAPRVEAVRPQASAFAANRAAPVVAGISGSVTDPSGSPLADATVTVRPATGDPATTAHTGNSGQFAFNGLLPGHYEVHIELPGFVSESRQVDVQPGQIARLDSPLRPGGVSEKVSVEASAGAINTASQSATTAAKGKIIVSLDADGTLFLSKNAGKTRKAVKPVWQGKAVRVITPPEGNAPPKAVFQLTTDAGVVWYSRDGNRWTQH